MTPSDLAPLVRAERPPDSGVRNWLTRLWAVLQRPFLALPFDIDPKDVVQAGWAVVFDADTPPAVRDALAPLIAHRGRRVPPDRCKVLDYRAREGVRDRLNRHSTHPGTVVPTRVPYYLLLVGGPEAIPFEFQYLLDVEYALGRLTFDSPEQYRQYAESVVAYETAAAVPNRKEIVYWGTRHGPGDATRMSADWLVTPLYQGIEGAPAVAGVAGYGSRRFLGDDATKANLAELLHPRPDSPARPCSLPPRTGCSGPYTTRASAPPRGPCCARTTPAPARPSPTITCRPRT
jgi:hypothetical protein